MWFFLKKFVIIVLFFWKTMEWNYLCFCPSNWNVDRSKMQEGPNNIPPLLYFRLVNVQSHRFELFRQGPRRDVFVNIAFFVNVICCSLFDQSFMGPTDWKYRSGTALLVLILLNFPMAHISGSLMVCIIHMHRGSAVSQPTGSGLHSSTTPFLYGFRYLYSIHLYF